MCEPDIPCRGRDIPCRGRDIPCRGTPGASGLHTQAHWYPCTHFHFLHHCNIKAQHGCTIKLLFIFLQYLQ